MMSFSSYYPCEKCERKFSCLQSLQFHRQEVHSLFGLLCHHCGKLFKRKCALKCHICTAHSSQVTPTVVSKFACHHCGKLFSRKDGVKTHILRFHMDASSQEKKDSFGETPPSIIGNGHGKLLVENSKSGVFKEERKLFSCKAPFSLIDLDGDLEPFLENSGPMDDSFDSVYCDMTTKPDSIIDLDGDLKPFLINEGLADVFDSISCTESHRSDISIDEVFSLENESSQKFQIKPLAETCGQEEIVSKNVPNSITFEDRKINLELLCPVIKAEVEENIKKSEESSKNLKEKSENLVKPESDQKASRKLSPSLNKEATSGELKGNEAVDSKKFKISESPMQNSREQFLLGLLPDLNEMSHVQFRGFRQQVCTVINKIFQSDLIASSGLC